MHTDAERNYAAKAARVRRVSREDESSLLDCTGGHKELPGAAGREKEAFRYGYHKEKETGGLPNRNYRDGNFNNSRKLSRTGQMEQDYEDGA